MVCAALNDHVQLDGLFSAKWFSNFTKINFLKTPVISAGLISLGFALTTAGAEFVAGKQTPPRPASLILEGCFGNTIPTPIYVRAHKAYLDTLPFQGLVVYLRDDVTRTNLTQAVMNGTSISEATFKTVLAPLKDAGFTNLQENFALVMGRSPPDFFDSWTNVVGNFAALAAALRDAGCQGVCFDNEMYFKPWENYLRGVKYPEKLLQAYQDQARQRGREVMEAMVKMFPSIAVIALHGPYISEWKAPESLKFPQWQRGNLLLGAFFAGLAEGAGATAVCVDGGELYTLRTEADFLNSYNWRKHDIASAAINCPFIPPALRSVWAERVSISYGVYDRPFRGAPMSPAILTTTLANAMHQADRYVWLYTEANTFLLPESAGGANAVWVNAVRQSRGLPPPP